MAASEHNPSRRALLGAAAALPVMSLAEGPLVGCGQAEAPLHHASHGSPPRPGEDLKWRRALAAYAAAEAEVRAIEAATRGASFAEEAKREEAYGLAREAMYDALRDLLAVPAPDLSLS
jgi:hypothetical protein